MHKLEYFLAKCEASIRRVQKDAIGSIGFCFGGHVVYLAATLPDIKVTASFYGGGITNSTPGGGEPTLTHTSKIDVPQGTEVQC